LRVRVGRICRVVVDTVDALESQRGRQWRADQRVFTAPVAQLVERCDKGGIEAVVAVPLRVRQAQPLHQRRDRFAAGEEHGGEVAPLGWRRGGGPACEQSVDLGGRGRHVEAGGCARRRWIPAISLAS
jgi:hypothetical protein